MPGGACTHSDRLAIVDRATGALLCGRCHATLVGPASHPDLSWAAGCPVCGVPRLVACVPEYSHRERWAEWQRLSGG